MPCAPVCQDVARWSKPRSASVRRGDADAKSNIKVSDDYHVAVTTEQLGSEGAKV